MPHGLKGGLKVKSFTQPPHILPTFPFFIDVTGQEHQLLSHQRLSFPDVFILYLSGINDRTAAESLGRGLLSISETALPPLPEETFYHKDLIGLSVIDPSQKTIGIVMAVHNFGAGDILEVRQENSEWMIPFSSPFIDRVCLDTNIIYLGQTPV